MKKRYKFAITTVAVLPLLCPTIARADIIDINPGHTVKIMPTLNTTDPNENGEGEPLVITADGKNIGVLFDYAHPGLVTYTAPPVLTAPGSPIPKTAINYYIQGADNDESASFQTALDPNPSPETPAQIATYNNRAANLGYTGAGITVLGIVCSGITKAPPLCGQILSGLGALTGAAGVYEGTLALDPIDPNYTVIATPANITLPSDLSATIGASLASDDLKSIEISTTLLTSINRYQGAVAAGDPFWTAQQLAAVNNYTGQLDTIDNNLSGDIHSFANQLSSLGFSVNLTPNDVIFAEQNIVNNGIQPEIFGLLTQLGLTQSDIQAVTQALYVQDANVIAGQYPNQLDVFADDLTPVIVPEPSNGGGSSSTGGGTQPQPVPEPLTCAGTAVAGGIGWLMKRKQAGSQKAKA